MDMVPEFAATVPPALLLKLAPMLVVPVPVVFSNVPALLITGIVPPLFEIDPSFTIFHTAPACTFSVPPFSINIEGADDVPNVLVPPAFTVRVSRKGEPDTTLIPPLALVTPLPLIVALLQVVSPVTVSVVVPVSVPPFNVRLAIVLVCPVDSVTVPLSTSIAALIFAPLLKFTVPPLITAVPTPVTFVPEFKSDVPPPNPNFAPDAML